MFALTCTGFSNQSVSKSLTVRIGWKPRRGPALRHEHSYQPYAAGEELLRYAPLDPGDTPAWRSWHPCFQAQSAGAGAVSLDVMP